MNTQPKEGEIWESYFGYLYRLKFGHSRLSQKPDRASLQSPFRVRIHYKYDYIAMADGDTLMVVVPDKIPEWASGLTPRYMVWVVYDGRLGYVDIGNFVHQKPLS